MQKLWILYPIINYGLKFDVQILSMWNLNNTINQHLKKIFISVLKKKFVSVLKKKKKKNFRFFLKNNNNDLNGLLCSNVVTARLNFHLR